MIVISKNKIIMYFGIFIIIVFTFIFFNNVNIFKQTEETVTLPVSGKVIVVDAGHGKPDERSRKFNRNNRGRDQPSYCIETSKFTRAKWMYSNFNKI